MLVIGDKTPSCFFSTKKKGKDGKIQSPPEICDQIKTRKQNWAKKYSPRKITQPTQGFDSDTDLKSVGYTLEVAKTDLIFRPLKEQEMEGRKGKPIMFRGSM